MFGFQLVNDVHNMQREMDQLFRQLQLTTLQLKPLPELLLT